MRFFPFLFLIAFSFSSFAKPIPLFHPPDDWEFVLPEHYSSFVLVGFLGKGSTPFRPSMNLATEEIDTSAREYLKAVKEIHSSAPSTTWRDLGKFSTRAGEGRLTEITTISAAGEVKMLQMILVKGNMAYILTGAAIKEDYLAMQGIIAKAFQSFSLPIDLLSALPKVETDPIAHLLEALGSSLNPPSEELQAQQWAELQRFTERHAEKMGKYWQFLILKEGFEKIYR